MNLTRLKIATLQQLRLQQRHGIHLVYLIVTLLYIALIRFVPDTARHAVAALIIISDPVFIGFFFIGGMLFLERSDRTHLAIAITPLTTPEQLTARILGLTLLGTLSATILSITALGAAPGTIALIALAVLLASPAGIIIGILVSSRFDTVNRFMAFAGIGLLPLSIPMLPLAGIHPPAWLCWLIPTQPVVVSIAALTGTLPASQAAIATAFAALLAWDAILWPVGVAAWDRYMLGRLTGATTEEA
jgi:fluoroquinolone transport system permease protein